MRYSEDFYGKSLAFACFPSGICSKMKNNFLMRRLVKKRRFTGDEFDGYGMSKGDA